MKFLAELAVSFIGSMLAFLIWIHWHLEEHWHERHERIAEERRRRREMKRTMTDEEDRR